MPKPLKIFLYLGLFFFCLGLFTYWTLPMDAFKSRLIMAAEKGLGPSYKIDIDKMSAYRLSGVYLKGVTLSQERDGKTVPLWKADKIYARAGLFSLLFRRPRVSFDIRSEGGRLTGEFYPVEDRYRLRGKMQDINLGEFPIVRLQTGLKVESEIDGEFDLDYYVKQPIRSEGKVNVSFDTLKIVKGELSLGEMGSIPLPDLFLADSGSGFDLNIGKGSVEVEKGILKGNDLDIDLKGRIFLAPTFDRYRMNLRGSFEFSPNVWGLLEPNLPEPWMVKLKEQKTGNQYPISVSGQVGAPQIYSGAFKIFPLQLF